MRLKLFLFIMGLGVFFGLFADFSYAAELGCTQAAQALIGIKYKPSFDFPFKFPSEDFTGGCPSGYGCLPVRGSVVSTTDTEGMRVAWGSIEEAVCVRPQGKNGETLESVVNWDAYLYSSSSMWRSNDEKTLYGKVCTGVFKSGTCASPVFPTELGGVPCKDGETAIWKSIHYVWDSQSCTFYADDKPKVYQYCALSASETATKCSIPTKTSSETFDACRSTVSDVSCRANQDNDLTNNLTCESWNGSINKQCYKCAGGVPISPVDAPCNESKGEFCCGGVLECSAGKCKAVVKDACDPAFLAIGSPCSTSEQCGSGKCVANVCINNIVGDPAECNTNCGCFSADGISAKCISGKCTRTCSLEGTTCVEGTTECCDVQKACTPEMKLLDPTCTGLNKIYKGYCKQGNLVEGEPDYTPYNCAADFGNTCPADPGACNINAAWKCCGGREKQIFNNEPAASTCVCVEKGCAAIKNRLNLVGVTCSSTSECCASSLAENDNMVPAFSAVACINNSCVINPDPECASSAEDGCVQFGKYCENGKLLAADSAKSLACGEVWSPEGTFEYNGPVLQSLPSLFAGVYRLLVPISIALGLFFIILSGYKFMMSEGQPDKVKEAQEQLTASIIGILFIMLSVVIMRLIIKQIFGFSVGF